MRDSALMDNVMIFDFRFSIENSHDLNSKSMMTWPGMPDCTMTFEDPRKFDLHDCAFHPCVRFKRFQIDQQLSFIPPDGKFKLSA